MSIKIEVPNNLKEIDKQMNLLVELIEKDTNVKDKDIHMHAFISLLDAKIKLVSPYKVMIALFNEIIELENKIESLTVTTR